MDPVSKNFSFIFGFFHTLWFYNLKYSILATLLIRFDDCVDDAVITLNTLFPMVLNDLPCAYTALPLSVRH